MALLNRMPQAIAGKAFDEVVLRTKLHGLHGHRFVALTRQHHDRRAILTELLPKLRQEIEAVAVGQVEVEQHAIRAADLGIV